MVKSTWVSFFAKLDTMPEVSPYRPSWPTRTAYARDVHASALEAGLSPLSAAVLTAQTAHETAWGRSARGYNLAGVKAGRWWREHRDYYTARTRECRPTRDGEQDSAECGPGETLETITAYWRSFPSLGAGVVGVLDLLGANRYTQSRRMLRAADPRYYEQLGRDGWYTAGLWPYYRACCRHLLTVCEAVSVAAPIEARLSTWRGRQAALQALGHDPGDTDGLPGPRTEAALRDAQDALGLVDDGTWGPLTDRAVAAAWRSMGG